MTSRHWPAKFRQYHSKPVKAWLIDHKEHIKVFYLPSYSPKFNPDERLNADLKYVWVHARNCAPETALRRLRRSICACSNKTPHGSFFTFKMNASSTPHEFQHLTAGSIIKEGFLWKADQGPQKSYRVLLLSSRSRLNCLKSRMRSFMAFGPS